MIVAVGTISCSNSSHFGPTSKVNVVMPVRLPPGRFRLATSPSATGSPPTKKTIGIVVVAAFAVPAPQEWCRRDDHGHLATNQIGRQRWQPIVLALRPAIFDRHVLALDIAGFVQALAERAQTICVQVRRIAAEKPYHRHSRLLRARGERPRGRRTTERVMKFAPPHVSNPRHGNGKSIAPWKWRE